MDTLEDLTMKELIELAQLALHKRRKNTEACLRYYHSHHEVMKEKARIASKKYYDLKKAKKLIEKQQIQQTINI